MKIIGDFNIFKSGTFFVPSKVTRDRMNLDFDDPRTRDAIGDGGFVDDLLINRIMRPFAKSQIFRTRPVIYGANKRVIKNQESDHGGKFD
jgi:hypothetical protein